MGVRKFVRLVYVFVAVCLAAWVVMYGVECATVFSREYAAAESKRRDAEYTWNAVCNNPSVHVPSMGEEGRTCERVRTTMDTVKPTSYALGKVVENTHSCLLCPCSEAVGGLMYVVKWTGITLGLSLMAPATAYKIVRYGVRWFDDRKWRRRARKACLEEGDEAAAAAAAAAAAPESSSDDESDGDYDACEHGHGPRRAHRKQGVAEYLRRRFLSHSKRD